MVFGVKIPAKVTSMLNIRMLCVVSLTAHLWEETWECTTKQSRHRRRALTANINMQAKVANYRLDHRFYLGLKTAQVA